MPIHTRETTSGTQQLCLTVCGNKISPRTNELAQWKLPTHALTCPSALAFQHMCVRVLLLTNSLVLLAAQVGETVPSCPPALISHTQVPHLLPEAGYNIY